MSQVLEVSEGFAPDRAPFQPPTQSEDEARPRYICFLGNLMEPQAMVERPWTKGGGVAMASPCLRTVHEFVRKGRITPLLKDIHSWQQIDVVKKIVDGDPLQRGYFAQQWPIGYTPPKQIDRAGRLVDGSAPTLVGKLAFPGREVRQLTGDAQNNLTGMPWGVVEITTLAGHDYEPRQVGEMFVDPTYWEIQRAIFPDYPRLPVLLTEIERLLDKATEHTMLRPIVDDMMNSLMQFSNYATTTIQNTHTRMKATANSGESPRYTAMDLVLLEQLGVNRQDKVIAEAVRQDDGDFKQMFAAFLQSQAEERQARAESDKRLAMILDKNTMAQTPIVEGQDGYPGQSGYSGYSGNIQASAEIEKIPCPDCGHLVTPKGMSFHQRRWCKGKDANV